MKRERERDFCLCVMDWLCVVPSQRSWWLSRLKADWHIHEDPIHLIPPSPPTNTRSFHCFFSTPYSLTTYLSMWLIWIVDLKGTFIVGEWIKKISLFRIVCHTGIIASAPSYLLPPLFSKKKKKKNILPPQLKQQHNKKKII